MWGTVENRQNAIEEAIEFTGDYLRYGSCMQRVVKEWPYSCENALTDYSLNRKAWTGHAAAALALRLPEDITRAAWACLSYEQQLLANKEASRAIQTWEYDYLKDKGLLERMGSPLLFAWDPG